MQREGMFASTSQIAPATYIEYFEPYLKAGVDIFYLCFSFGYISICIDDHYLKESYPGRKIICIDTIAATCGEGFLVQEAAKMQAKGFTIEQLTIIFIADLGPVVGAHTGPNAMTLYYWGSNP